MNKCRGSAEIHVGMGRATRGCAGWVVKEWHEDPGELARRVFALARFGGRPALVPKSIGNLSGPPAADEPNNCEGADGLRRRGPRTWRSRRRRRRCSASSSDRVLVALSRPSVLCASGGLGRLQMLQAQDKQRAPGSFEARSTPLIPLQLDRFRAIIVLTRRCASWIGKKVKKVRISRTVAG
jgi:hypothetical protein